MIEEKVSNSQDRRFIENFKRYKIYNLIRRNLRESYKLINLVTELQKDILEKENTLEKKDILEKKDKEVFQAKVNLHYSLLLYAKWFTKTESKLRLDKNTFFKKETEYLLETHDYIMKLRHKYIVHNEKDILGSGKVFINRDNLENIEIKSFWEETLIPNSQDLDKIKKCIELVHNIIDAQQIPKYEKNLKEDLQRNKVI